MTDNVRELRDIKDFVRACELFDDIWHFEQDNRPVTPDLMKALSHAGGYVAGAFDGDVLVGASVGFLAEGRALHSHITGARAGHGVGHALKLHQKAWALERGLERISWTYDPLVCRNAHFNLAKLGARPVQYLPGFYGVMGDSINQGDDSDRLLTVWELIDPPACSAEPAEVLLDTEGRVTGSEAPTVLVAVPQDVERLRRTDLAAARAWRLAVREVLGGLLEGGGEVVGFRDRRYYVVRRGTAASSARV
ncbi:GNAT family N-acetyltransferase [Nonomuraea sp. NPDC050328]|uniref:GNAT family N-acetyltransferase n=1 Tax=Nonomuraea sp. NPDC050328 TaxID=3364361 RepID=UPI00378AEF29